MISAFTNIFKIPELRKRVLFTLAMIVIVRAGAAITTPGVNAEILREWFRNVADAQSGGGVAALFNIFSGGALEIARSSRSAIMPYISASIMMQLLTAVIPQLGKLAKEDGGRQKIMQYTRYATIVLCLFQGYLLALSFENPQANPFLQESWTRSPGWECIWSPSPVWVSVHDRDHADRGDDVPDVARRSNHRSRHRQRYVADHHRRYRRAAARRSDSGVEHLRSERRGRQARSARWCWS